MTDLEARLEELQPFVDEAEFLRDALYLQAEGFIDLIETPDGDLIAVPCS